MSQRFGEFFLEPQWPSICQQNNPHFANLIYEDQEQQQQHKSREFEEEQHVSGSKSQKLKVQCKFEEFGTFCQHTNNQKRCKNMLRKVKSEQFSKDESSIFDNQSLEVQAKAQEQAQAQEYSQNQNKRAHINHILKIEQIGQFDNQQIEQDQSSFLSHRDSKQLTKIKQLSSLSQKNKKIKQYQRGKYKILSQQLKKKIVEQSKVMTMVEVARKYHVSVNNICRWRKRCDRRLGAGRKVTDMQMQCKLLDWLLKQHYPIPRKQVQLMAKKLSKQKDFKASKGWFQRFYKRNKLHYNPNIQILTYNDYRQRINQVMEERATKKCMQVQNDHNFNSGSRNESQFVKRQIEEEGDGDWDEEGLGEL